MKKEILGICICILLIATTVLQVAGEQDKKNITSTGRTLSVPILKIKKPPILNLGDIPFVLKNTGERTAEDISWEMKVIEGEGIFEGKLFSPKEISGTIPSLEPDEDYSVEIEMSGLGITTIYFNCKYTIQNFSGCDVEFEAKQEWKDLGLLSLHLFLPSMQPMKEWMAIEDYSYINETDNDIGVELYYEDVLQKHNVRVVPGSSSNSPEIEFLAACKFYNGTGVLNECWITKDIVTAEDAHWEIELVDGE